MSGRWTLYFYVPKGSGVVGGYSDGAGDLLDGSGRVVHRFTGKPGYYNVVAALGKPTDMI